jgi:hypothetical protein
MEFETNWQQNKNDIQSEQSLIWKSVFVNFWVERWKLSAFHDDCGLMLYKRLYKSDALVGRVNTFIILHTK